MAPSHNIKPLQLCSCGGTPCDEGKSRRQQKKEKQAARKNGGELCTAYVKGICNYPNCKYNHDVNLYANAKQADLPGEEEGGGGGGGGEGPVHSLLELRL